MRYPWLFSLTLMVLGGCTGLQPMPEKPLPEPPASATEAVAIADDLADNGRWSHALEVLGTASHAFSDEPVVEEHRKAMLARWQRQEREFEDQIMVSDAENRHQKIAVLEKLSLAEPDNLIVTSRRLYWKELLAGDLEPLTACAEFHVATNAVLARRCVGLASGIAGTPEFEQRLAVVGEKLRLSEQAAAERRLAHEEKKRKQRAKALLGEARTAIEARDYRGALDILQEVAKLQPANSEVLGLQQEALSLLSPQVEALVKLGDHLYLNEQLEAAVATWQAALILKPDDEAILARIDRAKTVLNRLDALRRQQNPVPAED